MPRTTSIKTYEGRPINGIDVSHWNGPPPSAELLRAHASDWLRFMGIKACHLGNKHMGPNHVDKRFAANRSTARAAKVQFVGMYVYLEPGDITEQVLLLAETVGQLGPNEFVYLDWEEHDITSLPAKAVWHMNKIFGQRWAVYVNDSTPSMTQWLQDNAQLDANDRVGVFHPDWSTSGWAQCQHYNADIWQVGIGPVEGWPRDIDINFITNWEKLEDMTEGWW